MFVRTEVSGTSGRIRRGGLAKGIYIERDIYIYVYIMYIYIYICICIYIHVGFSWKSGDGYGVNMYGAFSIILKISLCSSDLVNHVFSLCNRET